MGVKSPSQHIHPTSKAVLCEVRRLWPSCHRLSGLFGGQVGAFLDDETASLCPVSCSSTLAPGQLLWPGWLGSWTWASFALPM